MFVHDIEIDGTKSKNMHVQTEIYSLKIQTQLISPNAVI